MAVVPKIQSPCPYKGKLSDIMDGDICRLCKREVFDLTAMSDEARIAFMKSCETEVCVSYALPRKLAAAAFAAAAVMAPMAAAAEEMGEEIIVTAGGITDPAHVEFVTVEDDKSAPELPVVYEKQDAAAETPASAEAPSANSQS